VQVRQSGGGGLSAIGEKVMALLHDGVGGENLNTGWVRSSRERRAWVGGVRARGKVLRAGRKEEGGGE